MFRYLKTQRTQLGLLEPRGNETIGTVCQRASVRAYISTSAVDHKPPFEDITRTNSKAGLVGKNG